MGASVYSKIVFFGCRTRASICPSILSSLSPLPACRLRVAVVNPVSLCVSRARFVRVFCVSCVFSHACPRLRLARRLALSDGVNCSVTAAGGVTYCTVGCVQEYGTLVDDVSAFPVSPPLRRRVYKKHNVFYSLARALARCLFSFKSATGEVCALTLACLLSLFLVL